MRHPTNRHTVDCVAGTTSLFTDIVGSTEKVVELGDGGRELLERHNSIVRAQFSRFGGQEMDSSGDGFFAILPDPAHAICAARASKPVCEHWI